MSEPRLRMLTIFNCQVCGRVTLSLQISSPPRMLDQMVSGVPVFKFIIRLYHRTSLLVEGKFDRHRKTESAGEESLMDEKFGVVQCIHCGYIQGRELVGLAFSHQGPFKSVDCYNCKKSIPLNAVTVLFKSDSVAEAHGWLVAYKKQ